MVATIIIVLIAAVVITSSLTKTKGKLKGQNKCEFCGARIKSLPGGKYARACSKCGREQSWAAGSS